MSAFAAIANTLARPRQITEAKRRFTGVTGRLLVQLEDAGPQTARQLATAVGLPCSGRVGALLKHHINLGRVLLTDGTYSINEQFEDGIRLGPLQRLVQWIPVKERMPDADETVLIAAQHTAEPVWLGSWDGTGWRDTDGFAVPVTHWAEIPRGPSC